MLWGYGPAVDILDEISGLASLKDQREINVLLIGASDARHVLWTISRFHRHPKTKVNFYVTEVMLDMIARQILLILTALEPPEKLGLFEKTRMWMELYGNTLMRPNTAKYLVKKAHQLMHMVTDQSYLAFRLPLVSLSSMKYKERDSLETIFQFWAKQRFEEVVSLWDGRVRQSLGVRYDSREGVFDWDYYMRLKEVPEGSRIHPREYKQWRGTGVAFTWPEAEASAPNATLASGVVRLGGRLLHHGYLGDVVAPPYLAFGTAADPADADILDRRNGVNAHRSTDIVEANVRRMLHEACTQTEYARPPRDVRRLGTIVAEVTRLDVPPRPEEPDPDESDDKRVEQTASSGREEYSAVRVEGARVVFLPTELPRRPSLRDTFHVLMVSQNLTQRLSDEVVSLARDGALVLLETRKFLTNCTEKEKRDFGEHLAELAQRRGCAPLPDATAAVDGAADYLARFTVVRDRDRGRVHRRGNPS